jgi:hypothetical protein
MGTHEYPPDVWILYGRGVVRISTELILAGVNENTDAHLMVGVLVNSLLLFNQKKKGCFCFPGNLAFENHLGNPNAARAVFGLPIPINVARRSQLFLTSLPFWSIFNIDREEPDPAGV